MGGQDIDRTQGRKSRLRTPPPAPSPPDMVAFSSRAAFAVLNPWRVELGDDHHGPSVRARPIWRAIWSTQGPPSSGTIAFKVRHRSRYSSSPVGGRPVTKLYQRARQFTPRRWSGQTRDWTPVAAVTLNPERDSVIRTASPRNQLSGSVKAPAFPSRPDTASAVARNAGEERSTAARSHAQRPLRREHGEDGAHRTFPEVSTMAHSRSAGGGSAHRRAGQSGGAG